MSKTPMSYDEAQARERYAAELAAVRKAHRAWLKKQAAEARASSKHP